MLFFLAENIMWHLMLAFSLHLQIFRIQSYLDQMMKVYEIFFPVVQSRSFLIQEKATKCQTCFLFQDILNILQNTKKRTLIVKIQDRYSRCLLRKIFFMQLKNMITHNAIKTIWQSSHNEYLKKQHSLWKLVDLTQLRKMSYIQFWMV